jgi:hypothetical protein
VGPYRRACYKNFIAGAFRHVPSSAVCGGLQYGVHVQAFLFEIAARNAAVEVILPVLLPGSRLGFVERRPGRSRTVRVKSPDPSDTLLTFSLIKLTRRRFIAWGGQWQNTRRIAPTT